MVVRGGLSPFPGLICGQGNFMFVRGKVRELQKPLVVATMLE